MDKGMTEGARPTAHHEHQWVTSGNGHGYVERCQVCGANRSISPQVTIDKSLADKEPLHKILP